MFMRKMIYQFSVAYGYTARDVPWFVLRILMFVRVLNPCFPWKYLTPMRTSLVAFDPSTGEKKWEFNPPAFGYVSSVGDPEGYFHRLDLEMSGKRVARDRCQALPW